MNNLQLKSEQSSALQESLGISETSFNLLSLNCNSVENIPGINARAAFQVDSSTVFVRRNTRKRNGLCLTSAEEIM